MRRCVHVLLIAAVALTAQVAHAGKSDAEARSHRTVHAVYHFDLGLDQAIRGLRNIGNHLAAEPTVKITAVALGAGIDFLLEGAETAGGYPFELMVSELQARGVVFKLCRNTLESRSLPEKTVIADVGIVPSGVAEIARLQVEEGYAYIKP